MKRWSLGSKTHSSVFTTDWWEKRVIRAFCNLQKIKMLFSLNTFFSSLNFMVSLQNIKQIPQRLIWVQFYGNHWSDYHCYFPFFPSCILDLSPVCLLLLWLFSLLLFLQFPVTIFLISHQSNIHVERPMTPPVSLGFHCFFCSGMHYRTHSPIVTHVSQVWSWVFINSHTI